MLASYKKGAITIPFCLMVRPSPNCWLSAGMGVRKIPLYLFDIDEEFVDLDDD